jgi:hypothetical protein
VLCPAAGLSRTCSNSKNIRAPARALSTQNSAGRAASGIPLSPAATSPGSLFPSRATSFTGASRIPAAPAAAADAVNAADAAPARTNNNSSRHSRVSACSGVGSVGAAHQNSSAGGSNSRRISAASSNESGRSSSSSSTVRTIDYIREQRQVKELVQR